MGKVLIACEYSGIVRDAFIAAGHDAISCDLLPTERPGPHIQGDVWEVLREPWDLVIAHPPCNYLTHLTWAMKNHERIPTWWQRYKEGMHFFRECLNANAPMVAVENPPRMHPPARAILGKPDQRTDFRYFGSEYRKGRWAVVARATSVDGSGLYRRCTTLGQTYDQPQIAPMEYRTGYAFAKHGRQGNRVKRTRCISARHGGGDG